MNAALESSPIFLNNSRPRFTGLGLVACPSPKALGINGHKLLHRIAWNSINVFGKIGHKALHKLIGKRSREKLRLTPDELASGYGLDTEDFSSNLTVGFAEMRRREPWVQGETGLFADIEMMLARGQQAWGFGLDAIDFKPKQRGAGIQFWHGRDDAHCLSTRTRELCANIKGAEFHELPGLDHQTVLLKAERVLKGLLDQM